MICKRCGNQVKDDVKFCPHCGKNLYVRPQNDTCPVCGLKRRGEEQFCPSCGQKYLLSGTDFRLKWWDYLLIFLPFLLTFVFLLLSGVKEFEYNSYIDKNVRYADYIDFDSIFSSGYTIFYILALIFPFLITGLTLLGSHLLKKNYSPRSKGFRFLLIALMGLYLFSVASMISITISVSWDSWEITYYGDYINWDALKYNENLWLGLFVPATFCSAGALCSFLFYKKRFSVFKFAFASSHSGPKIIASDEEIYDASQRETPQSVRRPVHFDNIALTIFLSIVTLSVFYYVWVWRTTRYLRDRRGESPGCAGTVACMVLVPFYQPYWHYKYAREAYLLRREAGETDDFVGGVTVISLFVPFVSAAILMIHLNELKRLDAAERPIV